MFQSTITSTCENCKGDLSPRQHRDGLRFCSRACSNSAVPRIRTADSKSRVAVAVSRANRKLPRNAEGKLERTCIVCSAAFAVESQHRQRKTCSPACLNRIKRQNAIRGAQTKTLNGTHSGWHNRRFEPSYAEQYFIELFDREGITGWQREKKVGRWFVDFAFEGIMLAVEIDGRQHEDAERRQQDEQKDLFLSNSGWTVFRVKWTNPKLENGRSALHRQVEKLLPILRSL